jgi:hypothetical protein
MTADTELAWAAGFFDGEGSCCIANGGSKWPSLRLSIGQRDDWVLHRFRKAVGLGHINGPYERKTGGALWFYRCQAHEEVLQVLLQLWPYLSPRKKEQVAKCYKEYRRTRTMFDVPPRVLVKEN